jgi:hypothetical protein
MGLAAVAIAVLIGWAMVKGDAPPAPATASPEAAEVASLPASSAQDGMTPATSEPVSASSAPDEVQVCGGAWLKAGADGQVSAADAEAFRLSMLAVAKAPALATMEAGTDVRAQAAAELVRIVDAQAPSACDSYEACARAAELGRQAATAHRATLAHLAQDSTDAQTYGWAYRACHVPGAANESACQLVTSRQWARLDPSNAAPWLAMAAEAEKQGDAGAVDDAMFHVASAARQEQGLGVLPKVLIEHAPSGDAYLAGTVAMAIEGLAIDASASVPYTTATRYCGARNLGDANRRETCERIAELFVTRSVTPSERDIGLGMARRLGWPQERLDAIEGERRTLEGLSAREIALVDPLGSCQSLHAQLDRIRDIAGSGDVASTRRAVARAQTMVPLLLVVPERAPAEPQDEDAGRREDVAAPAASASSPASAASSASIDRPAN